MMAVTLKSIAAVSGVSIGTVDRVLHNRGGVSEETKIQVRKAAADLGYKSNIIGKALVTQRNPLKIGVIINAREFNYFAAEVWRGVEAGSEEIESFGVSVIPYPMEEVDEAAQLRLLAQAGEDRVNGLVIKPVNSPAIQRAIDKLVDEGISIITCTSDVVDSKRLCFVGHNHQHEGRMLGSLLSKVVGAEARIAIITGSMHVLGHKRKTEGFSSALMSRRPDAKILGVFETNHNIAVAVSIVEALCKDGAVDALCVQSMDKKGLESICKLFPEGEKPLICSFGTGEELSDLIAGGLVDFAIEENPYQQGYSAIRMMFDVLFNQLKPEFSFYEVDAHIVIDESYTRG